MIDAIRVHELDPKLFKKCDATVCRITQTYNPEDEKFHIGGAKLPLRNNDISRISSKVIKDLLAEAICGRTERDEEDVAKLLCLYVCAKLFFATTDKHIAVVGKLKVINLSAEGCIEVQCGKLVGTFTECHILKLAAATNEPKKGGRIRMDVDPAKVCNGRRAVVDTDDVGNVEPSFNCWQANTTNGGNMKMEEGNDYDNKNTGTPTSKEKVGVKLASRGEVWPVLFPDLLELSSTPDGEAVDRLESKISNLEDSLDDLEVHEVTQFVVNDGSNQRTPSNSLSGKVSGSGNVTSGENLTLDFAHGNVRSTVQGVEGSCSPRNAQSMSGVNIKDGATVIGVEAGCEHTTAATSSGPKITSLVKRVKNKPRRDFRLSDYEYPGIFGRPQANANVRLGKSIEPGVIYSVEDVEVERKT
ncbi:hypothetical protein ACSBR1_021415 [Camellia fascicularis]